MSGSRLRPVSAKRRRRDRDYQRQRERVYERSEGLCEARLSLQCRGTCDQVHHIAGRLGNDPHRLDNLLGCCFLCHEEIHRSPDAARMRDLMRLRLVKSRHGGDQ